MDNKQLTRIANTVANSCNCTQCEIKDFCNSVEDSHLCEYSWYLWIEKQIKEQKNE